jgi:hypothetical protein
LEARVAALCAAPAGCAFLLHVEAAGVTPEVAARPEVAVAFAAAAQGEIQPFGGDHDEMVARALANGPRLAGLAREILARPEAAWWFAPVERGAQLWLARSGEHPGAERLVTPTGEPDRWERYAQKPRGGLFTSTAIAGTSSALATASRGGSDYDPSLPAVLYRLRATVAARVFEVDGPGAWRRLCLSYPDTGEDGRVVPDWAAVTRDWDGVHLSLGGFLTAEQVRVDGSEGSTEHGGWDFEQTVWLRWVFDGVEEIGILAEYPPASIETGWPGAFRFDEDEDTPWRRTIAPRGLE